MRACPVRVVPSFSSEENMAFIVTLKLLIDLPTAAEAEEFISNAIGVNSLADSEVSSPILDYSIEACEPVARCLSDSIVNETYLSHPGRSYGRL